MEEINRFVMLAASGRFTLTELCQDFGVSRKTGHKWLRRYEAEGTENRVRPWGLGLVLRGLIPDRLNLNTINEGPGCGDERGVTFR